MSETLGKKINGLSSPRIVVELGGETERSTRSPSDTAIGGIIRSLKNRFHSVKKTQGGSASDISTGDSPGQTVAIEVAVGDVYPGISAKSAGRLLRLRQTSYSGDLGSTCVPVAIAAVFERIMGDKSISPLGEKEFTDILIEGGAKRGTNYILEKGINLLKTPGIKIDGDYDKPNIFDFSQPHRVTETLQAGGAAVIVDKRSDHAFAFLAIAEPGTIIRGKPIDSPYYLLHNGAPQVAISGLTESDKDGSTLSWVSAEQVARVAQERGFDMSVILATPDNTGFVPGSPNPHGFVSINAPNPS